MSLPSTHSAPNTESQPFTADVAREVTRHALSDRIENSLRIRELANTLNQIKRAARLGLSHTSVAAPVAGSANKLIARYDWKTAQLQDLGYGLEMDEDEDGVWTLTMYWGSAPTKVVE